MLLLFNSIMHANEHQSLVPTDAEADAHQERTEADAYGQDYGSMESLMEGTQDRLNALDARLVTMQRHATALLFSLKA